MPWIYIVRENLTDMGAEEYIPSNQKTIEEDKIGEVSSDKGTTTDSTITMPELKNSLLTSHSFQKKWQNEDGKPITEDYLGLGDITITGQLWVGVKDGDMKPASEFFKNGWDKWFTDGYWATGDGAGIKTNGFQIDLMIQLGNNDQTETISNLPRVAVENGDTKELVYTIVETGIKVTNPDYTQTFTWKWDAGKLVVDNPKNGLFTPQEITVGGSTTIINNRLQTTDLSVEKKWKGDENETDLRPDSITVVVQRRVQQEGGDQSEQADELTRATLMAPRTTEDGWENVPNGNNGYLTVKLEEANDWKETIPNLPTYGIQDNGLVTYDYRIRELKQGWTPDTIEDSILDANEKYDGHYTVSSYDEDGSTLTVTNTLTHMDITAVKAWKPEGLHGDYAEVTFELQSRVEGAGEWSKADVGKQENPVTLDGKTEAPAWTVTWTELPRENNKGDKLEYRVIETLSKHFGKDEDKEEFVEIIYPEEAITGSTADKTYTVTNIPLGQITVTKKGEDGGLPNVEFTLTGNDGKSYEQTTSADGTAIFTGLPLYDSNGT